MPSILKPFSSHIPCPQNTTNEGLELRPGTLEPCSMSFSIPVHVTTLKVEIDAGVFMHPLHLESRIDAHNSGLDAKTPDSLIRIHQIESAGVQRIRCDSGVPIPRLSLESLWKQKDCELDWVTCSPQRTLILGGGSES